MTKDQIATLQTCVDMKITSVRRAQTANTSPRFAEVYKIELDELNKLKNEVAQIKAT